MRKENIITVFYIYICRVIFNLICLIKSVTRNFISISLTRNRFRKRILFRENSFISLNYNC